MDKNHTLRLSIEEILNSSFGKYAKYIIQDRALPDIRDGLKPVQRRILYAMYSLGIVHSGAYKKSARTVGEVIGKYHPHGDSSIYEAMVRMSQEWKNNIPLLDMHGNKGSLDGDGAAAMRYTECRLAKFAEYMLENITKNTVKFIPNFDDSEQEPSYLPSLIPNLLINGSMGIAAGYATNIPPFNAVEVFDALIHRIDFPNCSLDTIFKIMPGPDFPTGGIINGISGIKEAYETGKGKFVIRGEFSENETNKKLKQLIITSIPYETNKANIIKTIDDLVFNEKISGILEVRDESDRNGVNIVIDIDPSKSLDIIKNFIYKNTAMQVSYAINFIVIHNRKPVLMNMLQVLDAYIVHATNILIRTLKYDLYKAEKKVEILKGLIKAMSILDDVIAVIRKSQSKDDAKTNLMQKFSFTELQADAIVNLKLYRLTSTDVAQVKKEHDDLELLINEIKAVLASSDLQKNAIKKIIRNYKAEFNTQRLTKVEGEIEKIELNEADLIDSKDVIVMITHDGYIKTTTQKSIESSTYGDFGLKSGDILLDIFPSNTANQVVVITSDGQYISIPCHKIKNTKYKEPAEHINNIITLGYEEKVIAAFQSSALLSSNDELLICTKHGLIKRVDMNELTFAKSAKSSSIINLKDNDKVVACQVISKNVTAEVVCITQSGLSIRFDLQEIPLLGKTAAGVKAQKLLPNDTIIACICSENPNKHNILISANRGFKRIRFDNIPKLHRANIGKLVMLQVKSDPFVLNNAMLINPRDTLNVLTIDNEIKTITASEIALTDLNTRFGDLKTGDVAICYRDNWVSKDINKVNPTTVLQPEDDNDNNDDDDQESQSDHLTQGRLF